MLTIDVTVNDRAIEDAIKDALTRAMNRLVERVRDNTPVDTGFLRSNWFWTHDRGVLEVRGTYAPNVEVNLPQWMPDFGGRASLEPNIPNTLYIVNNVEYAALLEYGRGGATQAHIGFFRNTFT